MSRWFRLDDDVVNDPKVQRLPGDKFKAWINLLCLASKNDGILPSLPDIAYVLRMDEEMVSRLLDEFCSILLLDPVELADAPMSYEPHNWNVRQFKSDVTDPTAPERMKRYRDKKRNERNATVTVTPTRAETEQKQITEAEKKDCAVAPLDPAIPEREYFLRGREVLGKGAGGLIGKLLKAKGGNVSLARAALEQASQKQNPTEYIAAICRGPPVSAKPLTEFQRRQAETNDVRAQLRNIANGGGSCGTTDRHLPIDPGQRPESVRGGAGPVILAIPRASGNGSG